jgi:hypothetical protein
MNDKLSVIVKAFAEAHINGVTPAEMLTFNRDIEAVFKAEPTCDFGDALGQINDNFQKCIEA